jgi:hypothetical protein
MQLILQTDAQAREYFTTSEEWPADDGIDHGANPTPAMLRTLADLAQLLPDDVTLTVCRDWEGMPIGVFDRPGDAERAGQYGVSDIVALTNSGRIGAGGINLPLYFDSVVEYICDSLFRQMARYADT